MTGRRKTELEINTEMDVNETRLAKNLSQKIHCKISLSALKGFLFLLKFKPTKLLVFWKTQPNPNPS